MPLHKPSWAERRDLHTSVSAASNEVLGALCVATGLRVSQVLDGILCGIAPRDLADGVRHGHELLKAAERAHRDG